jgi:hypothetical protein
VHYFWGYGLISGSWMLVCAFYGMVWDMAFHGIMAGMVRIMVRMVWAGRDSEWKVGNGKTEIGLVGWWDGW